MSWKNGMIFLGGMVVAGMSIMVSDGVERWRMNRAVQASRAQTVAVREEPVLDTVAKTLEAGVARHNRQLDAMFKALAEVEQGTGPGGVYCITRGYWQDARVTWAYSEVSDPANDTLARLTCLAYWRRYCPRALDAMDVRTLAAVHNGGPSGRTRPAAVDYAERVNNLYQEYCRDR